MKFSFTRKVSLKRYGLDYETADFMVEDAETKEQAQKAVEDWMTDYVEELEARNKLTVAKVPISSVSAYSQSPSGDQATYAVDNLDPFTTISETKVKKTITAKLDPIAPRKVCQTCNRQFNYKQSWQTECRDCYKPKK